MKLIYVSGNVLDVQKHLKSSLSEAGVETSIFSYSLRRHGLMFVDNNVELYYRSNSYCRGPLFYITRLKKAAEFFLLEYDFTDVNIIHSNMFFPDGFIGRLISKSTSIPYVVSVRNTDINLWFLWKLPWIRRMGLQNLLDAKAVIFLSKPYMTKLISRIPENYRDNITRKSYFVPNGIDDFWLNNIYKQNRTIGNHIKFITVGRIEKNKNQLFTAQAIDRYRKESGINVCYTVIGTCNDKKMGVELEKYDFVRIKPFMCKELLIDELRKHDIFILLSHTETFGLVYAEALTQGLPVIYTSNQGFDQQFEDGIVGIPVISTEIDSVVNGIIKVVDDYETMSYNALTNCKNFNWDCIAQRLKDIYCKVI